MNDSVLEVQTLNYKDVPEICYKERYRIYCEEKKWLNASEFENGLEKDEFDKYSKHILIKGMDGKLKAYSRLIIGKYFHELPVQSFPGLAVMETPLFKVEASRFIAIDKQWSSITTFIMLRQMLHTSLDYRVRHAYIVVDPCFVRYLKYMGFITDVQAGPADYFGSSTLTARIDVRASYHKYLLMHNAFGKWFLSRTAHVQKDDFIIKYLKKEAVLA